MNEINEQFNTEGENKKLKIFYFAIIALTIFVVVIIVVIIFIPGNNIEEISPATTSFSNENRNIDKQKTREDLAKTRNFTLTEKDKQNNREDLVKPSNFTVKEEDKQATRESLAQ